MRQEGYRGCLVKSGNYGWRQRRKGERCEADRDPNLGSG